MKLILSLFILFNLLADAEIICPSVSLNCLIDSNSGQVYVEEPYNKGFCGQIYLKQCIIKIEKSECSAKINGLSKNITSIKNDNKKLSSRVKLLERRIKRLVRKKS